jgi:hypothetical protein
MIDFIKGMAGFVIAFLLRYGLPLAILGAFILLNKNLWNFQ